MPGRYTYYIIIISCICLLLVGCDRISEDERLIYEKPEPAQRVVLLEDFTGQRCTNCSQKNPMPHGNDFLLMMKNRLQR